MKTRSLMPLGGSEQSSGYKGYGISAMVEVLCGITAGSKYGHHIRTWKITNTSSEAANLGQTFIVMDPNHFAPGFKERVSESLTYWRKMEPVNPKLPVIAPGDMERLVGEKTDREGTITYVKRIIEITKKLAKELKVKPLKELPIKK
ncbi:Malate/L-sulfolactate dehydrogenase [Papilio xuthus]|uniref:Malate/L-sulfolactate dehydrogenase n=1 Tax=Papilio xuthus TaxID=66420 RepID=A0A0N1I2Y6_PAPXU|nr:Malate/L-sulfolactate dehydrogenase [Papilio xuthus]